MREGRTTDRYWDLHFRSIRNDGKSAEFYWRQLHDFYIKVKKKEISFYLLAKNSIW